MNRVSILCLESTNSLFFKWGSAQNGDLDSLMNFIDDWTPAMNCSASMPPVQSNPEVILNIYHGAYHDFDWEGMDEIYEGRRLLYDQTAAQDAIIQVKSFLAKYLK